MTTSQQHAETGGAVAAKLTAAMAVPAATLAGFTLQDWVYITAIIYSLLLIIGWFYDRVRPWLAKRKTRRARR